MPIDRPADGLHFYIHSEVPIICTLVIVHFLEVHDVPLVCHHGLHQKHTVFLGLGPVEVHS